MSRVKYQEFSDDAILAFIRNGDREAADYLMERYKNLVKKKAKTLFLIGNDREDLIQEGMIGLYKAVRDYKQESEASFQTFAELCVTRQMYNAVKISNTKKHQPLNNYISFDALKFSESPSLNPEEMVIGQVNAMQIETQLYQNLSKMEQEVLTLYLQDYRYTQIAAKLDKTPKTIDNAIQRIKKKLHHILKDS